MGAVIAIVVIAFLLLFVLSKSVNSINKSIQRVQGRDRCVACKSRLKAANGQYATTCRKCGATQPGDFERGMAKSKMVLHTGERGIYVGPVIFDSGKGQLVLTNKRLHYKPNGNAEQGRDWPLEDLNKVVRLTDGGGFAVDTHSGERYLFRAGKKTQWYDQVFATANGPIIKQLRSQKTSAMTMSASQAASPQPEAPTAPPAQRIATPAPPPPGTPAGWLVDPVGQHEQRYWNGSRWTEHVSTAGEQTTAFL